VPEQCTREGERTRELAALVTKHLSFNLCVVIVATVLAACPSNAPWRSVLYPEDWTPDYTDAAGRFLHDFSYAGYHNGEDDIPDAPPAQTFSVLDYGADNTGATDSTAAIQAAINAAQAGGGIVLLPAGVYRCDGILAVTQSGVVLRGEGPTQTTIYFTRTANMAYNSHIAFSKTLQRGQDRYLAVDGENRSHIVCLDDATGLEVGDEVAVGWVITDEFVAEHGMTGTWQVFNGQWRPFFRRTITDINTATAPHQVTLDVPLRYPAKVRDAASLRAESGYLTECGLEHLAIANAVSWADAWAQYQVQAVSFQQAADCWIRNVHSVESPLPEAQGFHLQSGGFRIQDSKRMTIADCQLENTQNRGVGGCGYLYQISQSNEVLIRDCIGRNGRHNFIQNWGFGNTGCVFLRCHSTGSSQILSADLPVPIPALCEYHHSLATACLVDQCQLDDGWYTGNRKRESSGAGHSATQNVFWNTRGFGIIKSYQFGHGYVIGTRQVTVATTLIDPRADGTEPEDYVEGKGRAQSLVPASLYEDQLARRLAG